MPTDAEREALWRIVAGRDVDGYGRTASQVVTALLAAGYHNGPRLPAPETPEWDAAVEAMAKAIWEHADDEVGWTATLSLAAAGDTGMQVNVEWTREEAALALRALLGGKDNG